MSDCGTILLIDDEEAIRTLARTILERAGYNAIVTPSGELGLEMLRSRPDHVDLIIVDYSLDGLSGTELVAALRSVAPTMPIIISSGEDIDLDRLPTELQVDLGFLQKPYKAEALVEIIKVALRTPLPDQASPPVQS